LAYKTKEHMNQCKFSILLKQLQPFKCLMHSKYQFQSKSYHKLEAKKHFLYAWKNALMKMRKDSRKIGRTLGAYIMLHDIVMDK